MISFNFCGFFQNILINFFSCVHNCETFFFNLRVSFLVTVFDANATGVLFKEVHTQAHSDLHHIVKLLLHLRRNIAAPVFTMFFIHFKRRILFVTPCQSAFFFVSSFRGSQSVKSLSKNFDN